MEPDPASGTFDVALPGCRAEPLGSYLKALGVLRLVSEQKSLDAVGYWRGEHFVLRSALSTDDLIRYFVEEWRPTPIVSPWNGGSGFWPSTSDEALRSIETSRSPRLAGYVATISLARGAINKLGLTDAPEKGEQKTRLLTYLRSLVSDEALAWLDAAAVLTDDEPIYPALLGTGGNDGRQDFSNNFMQRVLAVLHEASDIGPSLLGTPARSGVAGSMGQFSPTSLGRSNPWDFILAIEGSLTLAGAATRRLEAGDGASLAFPFHARATAAPSIAEGEEGHGELWLPRWTVPSGYREVRKLFAEGRAKTQSGSAGTGLDFARSIAGLGVDRGLTEFIRFSFQPRNGKNYFATPLGRFHTGEVRSARLLDDLDGWIDNFRRRATGKNAPARVALAYRRLEQSMLDAASTGAVGPALLCLGDAELALSRSSAFTQKAFLRPVPRLQQAWIAASAGTDSAEFRLAATLAARPRMRERLAAVDSSRREFADDDRVIFRERPLIENLHALLLREDVELTQGTLSEFANLNRTSSSLTDIAYFIAGDLDHALLERWLRALVLIERDIAVPAPIDTLLPPAVFAVLALVHHRRVGDEFLPRTTGVLARACAGDSAGATTLAIHRLSAIGRRLPVDSLVEPNLRTRRIAAALAFPLTSQQRKALERLVLPAATSPITHSTGLESATSSSEPA